MMRKKKLLSFIFAFLFFIPSLSFAGINSQPVEKADKTEIDDLGSYFVGNNVEAALQEIGAKPFYVISSTNISNWNTAYGWGDHSLAGYLTSTTGLLLNQSTPQTITASPIFNWGTSTRVPFYSGTKTLTDDADLTFDGTTLTAGGFTTAGIGSFTTLKGDTITSTSGTASNFPAGLRFGPDFDLDRWGMTPTYAMVLQSLNNNNPTRLYLIPKGSPAAGLQSGIKLFATDYIADAINYSDFGLYHSDLYCVLNTRGSGTVSSKPFVFADNDSSFLAIIETDADVGIGNVAPQDVFHITRSDATSITLKVQNTAASDSELLLSTSSTTTNATVGASIYADRTDAAASGDTDLIFKNSAGTTLNSNAIIKSTGDFGLNTLTPATIGTNNAVTGTILNVFDSASARIYARGATSGEIGMEDTDATSGFKVVRWINNSGTISLQRIDDGFTTVNSTLISIDTGNTITFGATSEIVYTPSSAQVIDAVGDTILVNATIVVLNPDADYTLTSAPTIVNGTTGQIVYITCANGEANTVTVQDQDSLASSNLQLGAATRAISGKDVLVLLFDGTDWIEVSYANN